MQKARQKEYLKRYYKENKQDYLDRKKSPEQIAYQKQYLRGDKWKAYYKEWRRKKRAEMKAQKAAERAQKDDP